MVIVNLWMFELWLFKSYTFFVIPAILVLLSGGSSALRAVLIPDLFGAHMAADTFSICYFFSAIAAFVGLPKTGLQTFSLTLTKLMFI